MNKNHQHRNSSTALLQAENLSVYFPTRTKSVHAVDCLNLTIHDGQTTALVGESGCGKSITALSFARLIPHPGYIARGSIRFRGKDVMAMNSKALQNLRGAQIAYIFQEPSTSLNPVFRIGTQIAEAIRLHRKGAQIAQEVKDILQRVGLPAHCIRSYPLELSGGMQQRVMIAMALACQPDLLIADEPTTALDVTIQAQILDLLTQLQKELEMAILLITHNLGLVADIADWIYVMYAGQIVEAGHALDLLEHPAHPYTKGLLKAIPRISGNKKQIPGIPGSVPNPADLPSGCRFHPRCPIAQELCFQKEPDETYIAKEHMVRCHFLQ